MASIRTVFNTTCVKFNKMCEPYPRVNTGSETKTSHRDVDRSNGPDNQQPKIGWKTFPVWEQLTEDWWVLQAVSGYQLELAQTPWQAKPAPKIQCSIEEQTKISMEIKELLDKRGNKGGITLCRKLCFSNLFCGKGRGEQRPVINLKCLNSFVKTKMEGLHILPHLIQQNDWMIKMDLKNAYLQVTIHHQESQHLLKFQWEDKSYQFQCLPFGLTSATRVFSKVMKPVVGTLRHMGIRLVIYLDDFLILHQGKKSWYSCSKP